MDHDAIEEMFQSVGPVTIKRMFGGQGVYVDGRIFAVRLRGEMMLKGDEEAGALYEQAGSRRWVYTHNKTGKPVKMPYWSVPEDAWDDPDEMARWVRVAVDAAMRG
ncbi:TfoX/Sxy family protein [Rhizobium sp. L1K21]|uniref:TfoX/Sxy family protein n=1 Tax=Rhizobium sp. L1K21 TaxID=2954933 RepID=UPI0020922F75|nr:TfoX/Sxy family protein [Rhizobium sp. L1K21]MCO6185755.1 TfoX/Sxy family protein [Rhizobium sp. L1K21]